MMTKTKRIERLEQRVAELMGEVERLKGEVANVSAPRPVWPSSGSITDSIYSELVSNAVELSDDAKKVLYTNRMELYG